MRAICLQSWAGSTAAPRATLVSEELGRTKGNDSFSLDKTPQGGLALAFPEKAFAEETSHEVQQTLGFQ